MTYSKRKNCPPLTARQTILQCSITLCLTLLLAFTVSLFAKPAPAKSFISEPERGGIVILPPPQPEGPNGQVMLVAWQTLQNVSVLELSAWFDNFDTMPINVQKAVAETYFWAQQAQARRINLRNPFGTSGLRRQHKSISEAECVLTQQWLWQNKTETTALWLYLSEIDMLSDNMRLTAANIVAMATAPDAAVRAEDFLPYQDLSAFINYLALPKQLPSCASTRGKSTLDMLIFGTAPQNALTDVHRILVRQVLGGDLRAFKHLAWLVSVYYVLSSDPA